MPCVDIQQNADRPVFSNHSLRKQFRMTKVINRRANITVFRKNAQRSQGFRVNDRACHDERSKSSGR
jgi:hypothetical protein